MASRLAELYFRPSVVLTYDGDGIAIGSSRSVRGFDVYSAIKSTRDLLENFGGHTNAVGLSLKEENISEFRKRLSAYVEKHIETQQVTPQLDIDCELSFDEINYELIKYMRMFNPFGPENVKPVFMTLNVRDIGTSKLVGKKLEHIKLEIVDANSDKVMNGIAFNMGRYYDYIKKGLPFDICYTIEENKHRNSSYIQLLIKGINIHEDVTDEQNA